MKKIYAAIIISMVVLSAIPAQAHDLIPKEILEYISENPNASKEEIQLYAESVLGGLDQSQDHHQVQAVAEAREEQGFFSLIQRWIKLGVEHILIGPDHILFVIALVLISIAWKDLLKLITSFTIAHTITFLIAGAGLWSLAPSIVEPLIALSIAYVAISSVVLSDMKGKFGKWFSGQENKISTVFFFGLFHGLGFAGLLEELQIPQGKQFFTSLLSFNVGVEIGQLIILTLAIPIIYLMKKTKYQQEIRKVLAIIISAISVFWFVSRL